MEAYETIRSRSNPALKRVGAVHAGKEAGVLVLEGDRLIDDALAAGVIVELVLLAEDREGRADELSDSVQTVRLVERDLLQRVSTLEHGPGSLAICRAPSRAGLDALDLAGDPLILVVAGVSDPGNLGAIARSAEAAGVRALIVLEGSASPWNGKALRGSMGSLLRLPVVEVKGARELADAFASRGFRQAQAATRDGTAPGDFDWSGSIALWVSGETGSLPDVARDLERLSIPMHGDVESLNVAAATTLLVFAAGRASATSKTRGEVSS